MSTPQLERLRAHCHQLRLYQVEAELTTLLEQAAASAILDQLLRHSITVNIRGESYRLKERLKAGLLKAHSTFETHSPKERTA
jgi:hypothetical protein